MQVDAALDRRRNEVLAHLERGDRRPLDAEVDGGAEGTGSWHLALWRGMRALLEGRVHECQRHNAEALARARRAGAPHAETSLAVQTLHLRVAQGRLAEMEAPLRALAAEPSATEVGRASLAWLLGLLGRDREARAELSGLVPDRSGADPGDGVPGDPAPARTERDRLAVLVVLAEAAAQLDQRAESAELFDLLQPHRFRIAVDGDGAICHGSVSRHLGLLAHVLGRWDEADSHFENALIANRGIGAPLLAAHTCRDWSALLRARGDGHDWDRAIELLADAEAIYRRLGVDGPAADAQAVLARAAAHDEPPPAGNTFRRDGDGWVLRHAGRQARVGDATGMAYLERLLAHPGQAFHVADLGLTPPAGSAALDDCARREYTERRDELGRRLTEALHRGDRMEAALARAEHDRLGAELAAATGEGAPPGDPLADPLEQARMAVATAIRLSLERIDAVHPDLGRHLRLTVRTGMFCSYVPPVPTTWRTKAAGADA